MRLYISLAIFIFSLAGPVQAADCSGCSFQKVNWTTSEQVHPTEMVDDDIVYYKKVSLGTGPASGSADVAHGITNLDKVIGIWTIWDNGSLGSDDSAVYEMAPDAQMRIYVGDTYIRVIVTASKADRTGTAYVFYTKTGD
jgi:hypothetical protein